MSGSNLFTVNESTSVIKIDKSVLLNGNPTFVDLSNSALPGQIVTVFDADGVASPTYPIWISSANSDITFISSVDGAITIQQRFGYVTLNSVSPTTWSIIASAALPDTQTDYSIRGLASQSTSANTINLYDFVSSGTAVINKLNIIESLSINKPLHTSTLYINAYQSYVSTSSVDSLLTINDIIDLNSTTSLSKGLNITDSISSGSSVFVGRVLSTFGPASMSSLNVGLNARVSGDVNGAYALSVSGYTSISSITTMNGSLTVGNNVQAHTINTMQASMQQMIVSDKIMLGQATLLNTDPYITANTSLYSPTAALSTVSTTILSTGQLITSAFSPLTTSIKNIIFASTSIINQLGSLEISSIKASTCVCISDLTSYNIFTAPVNTSSINVYVSISTTGVGTTQVSTLSIYGSGIIIAGATTVSSVFISSIVSANTLTLQNMVTDKLNTPFTNVSTPITSSIVSGYVAPIASGYQIESDTYGIFNGAPFPANGSVIRITNVSNETITSITITDSSSSIYTHPASLGVNRSFNLTVGNIYLDVESNGYLQIQMASASRSLTGKLVRIPTSVGNILQLETIPTTTSLVATGGTVTTSVDRKFHTFTTNGTFTISATTGVIVEVMMIGGGGGGGGWSGGGGGAGNAIVFAAPLGVGSYSVTIGQGGAGGIGAGAGYSSQGTSGGATTFGSIATALGGGGGGTYSAGGGRNGGSGGGGASLEYSSPGGAVTGSVSTGTVVKNLAFSGGAGISYHGSAAGAGGGGASGPGGSVGYPPLVGGNGGGGFRYIIGNTQEFYGGGGGGCEGGTYWGSPTAGLGGEGGGGNGSATSLGLQAVAGTANTGGGGGGGGYGSYGVSDYGGAPGGSGIVVVSYSLVGSGSFSIIRMETVTASAVNIIPSTITSTTTVRYETPGEYVWTAPAGVSSIFLSLTGGGGGGGNQSPSNVFGGAGGALSGTMAVTPGCNYTLEVGGGGGGGGTAQTYNSAAAGGYPGGGTPSFYEPLFPFSGGAGGGFSAISIAGTYLAIAGAGGGNAGIDSGYGGAGGGLVGGDGQNPGGGGSQSMGGLGWATYNNVYAYFDDGGYLFGGASAGIGDTEINQTEGGGGAGYYGGGGGFGGGGGSSYISTGALISVTNTQGGGGAGGRGGIPGEPGRDGSITISYSGQAPSLTIGAGDPITLTTSDVYNGGSLYWQMALPAITDSGTMFIVGTEVLPFSLISYGSSYIYGSNIMDSPVSYSPGDILSVYSDGSTGSTSNYGTAYVYLSSILIATLPSYLNTSPQNINIAKTQSTTNSYAFSNVLFGPAQIIYAPSTIFFSTINSNTIIDYVSMQNAYITMNTNSLVYASTTNVDSFVSTTRLTSVSTLRAPTPFSYLTIGPAVVTDLISSSVLTASTINTSTCIISKVPFNPSFNLIPPMPNKIGSMITLSSTTPYLTAFDVTNYYNPTVPSLSPGYFPYYYITGTLQSNVALARNEILGGSSHEHSILKADAFAATGLVLDWFLLNPATYSNAYLNLRFSQARASGNIAINGSVIFTFDSMINSNVTSITLNDFNIKTYPMQTANSRGYPSITPWIELTYYSNNGVLPTKFPLMEIWVSDKKIADDTSSRLDTNGLVTMNKGYMYFSTPVNGINIFNSQNDMSVRNLFHTGTLSFASDPILKEQIEPANLEICRQTVSDLPLRRYTYINDYQSTFQLADTRRLGVLSSEYGRHFPKAITQSPEQVLPGISTTAMIDTDQLVYSHIGATQQLISTVEHLSTLLVTLRKERDRRRTVTT